MNATAHALATAPAHALAHASFAGSVSAKGREGKGQDRTAHNGVFRWGDFSIHLSLGNARAERPATSPSRRAERLGWMAPNLEQGCQLCGGFLALNPVTGWVACTNCGWRP